MFFQLGKPLVWMDTKLKPRKSKINGKYKSQAVKDILYLYKQMGNVIKRQVNGSQFSSLL